MYNMVTIAKILTVYLQVAESRYWLNWLSPHHTHTKFVTMYGDRRSACAPRTGSLMLHGVGILPL